MKSKQATALNYSLLIAFIPCAVKWARAMMVSMGFTPLHAGKAEPSATKRPCTSTVSPVRLERMGGRVAAHAAGAHLVGAVEAEVVGFPAQVGQLVEDFGVLEHAGFHVSSVGRVPWGR